MVFLSMKTKLSSLVAIVLLTVLLSCEKESERIDNYLVVFATAEIAESTVAFRLDDGTVLKPETDTSIALKDGMRVILNYTPLENELITINRVQPIFMDVVKDEGYPDKVKTSPIKIVSIWVNGHYLNMSFEVDYHSKSHATGLFRDVSAVEPTLYFSYSREDDPAGAPVLNYLSFDLRSLGNEPFTVYVNTYEKMREFTFQVD